MSSALRAGLTSMGPDDRDPLPFVHGALPRAFRRWQVVLTAGAIRPYDPAEWRGALVVVQGNELELVCREGRVTRLHDGAVGFLAGLPLALLRNPGPADLRLVAVARSADEFCAPPPSLPPNDPNAPPSPGTLRSASHDRHDDLAAAADPRDRR